MDGEESHIVLCGLGRVGLRVLDLLVRLGRRVVVITTEPPPDWPLPGCEAVRLIQGDARNDKLLLEAGVASAQALIVTLNDDLASVAIAFDARRLNPNLNVVARLFDQDLAAHLERTTGIRRALSTSALAAPAFVAAALGGSAHGEFEVDDATAFMEEARVAQDGTTAGAWAAENGCSIIAARRNDQWLGRPATDTLLQSGDVLTVLRLSPRRPDAVPQQQKFSLGDIAAGLRAWWQDVPRALRAALVTLGGVVLASVLVFKFTLGLPTVDSLYFVVTIITTVGFGDYNLMNAPAYMKIYGSLLMLCGAAIMAILFSIMTDLVLSTRFRDVLARGSARSRGHIIVAGLGNVGFRVVRQLVRAGEKVVAIEREGSSKFVETARALAPVVSGNARTEETLQQAGLAGAKAVLAVTDDDIANLGIGLVAKRARPDCRVVLRVFDAALAGKMHGALGVDAVLSVSGEAAATFAAAALQTGALHGLLLGSSQVAIFRRTTRGNQPLAPDEAVLWVRRNGKWSVCSGVTPSDADEIIGARWLPLREG